MPPPASGCSRCSTTPIYVSAAGELADVEHSVAAELAEPDAILDAAFNKTAVYSFRAPLGAGAVLAGAPEAALAILERAGGHLGLAFQLVDDLIGAFGSEEQAGREAGGDLRESKRTPLVAIARQSTSRGRASTTRWPSRTPDRSPSAMRSSPSRRAARACGCAASSTTRSTMSARAARDRSLPADAGALLRSLADAVESRVP